MTRIRCLFVLGAILLAAGSAIGSGSTNTGGSGGGGTGGGGTGGGTTATCAPIQSFKLTSGYYKGTVGAIWTNYSLQQCNGASYMVHVTATNLSTGLVSYVNSSYLMNAVLDYDFAPFNTSFRFDFSVIDLSTGAVVDSRSAIASTPTGPQTTGTIG